MNIRWLLIVVIFLLSISVSFPVRSTQPRFTLLSPLKYQMFQRDWETYTGEIPIIVEANGFQDYIQVDVQWNDSEWQEQLLKRAVDNLYRGTLTNQSPGQGNFQIRLGVSQLESTLNDDVSVEFIGIGDVFLISGQSNSVGLTGEQLPGL